MHRHGLGPALASLIALAAPTQSPQSPTPPTDSRPELRQFTNLNRSFHIDMPAGWRQLAPGEALQLAAMPSCPEDLRSAQPRMFYAVGPVDRWLAGDFTGPWLYAVEQGNEWFVEDDFAGMLAARWHERGQATGVRYDLAEVRTGKVGPAGHDVRLAVRTSQKGDARATKSLDVYAPAGGQQFTLCAQHRVNLVLIEQVDTNSLRLEEYRLGWQLIGAHALRSATSGNFQQTRDLTATAREATDLQSDLITSFLVLSEVDRGEPPTAKKTGNAVTLYDLTDRNLHHLVSVSVAASGQIRVRTYGVSVSLFTELSLVRTEADSGDTNGAFRTRKTERN